AVQRRKFKPGQFEGGEHDAALRPRPRVAIACNAPDLGVLEDRNVKDDGFLDLIVEPEERLDLLHVWASFPPFPAASDVTARIGVSAAVGSGALSRQAASGMKDGAAQGARAIPTRVQ